MRQVHTTNTQLVLKQRYDGNFDLDDMNSNYIELNSIRPNFTRLYDLLQECPYGGVVQESRRIARNVYDFFVWIIYIG